MESRNGRQLGNRGPLRGLAPGFDTGVELSSPPKGVNPNYSHASFGREWDPVRGKMVNSLTITRFYSNGTGDYNRVTEKTLEEYVAVQAYIPRD